MKTKGKKNLLLEERDPIKNRTERVMVTVVRRYKSKRKHGVQNGRCFQAKAEWIDMNTPMNVSWSVILILKKAIFLKSMSIFCPFH